MSTYPTVRPSLTLDFQKSKQLDPRISFSRSSTATYVEGGVVKTADEHQARFEEEGLLIEESRTNNTEYSTYEASNYQLTNVAETTNQLAPDGTFTAVLLTENTATGLHQIRNQSVQVTTNGTAFTWSVFVKLNGRTKVQFFTGYTQSTVFDVTAGTVSPTGSGTITAYADGWYRLTSTSTAIATGNIRQYVRTLNDSGANNYAGDGTSGFYVWGWQSEGSVSFPTSYIPTSGSTVTRAAETCQLTGNNFYPYINRNAFTIRFNSGPVEDNARLLGWGAGGSLLAQIIPSTNFPYVNNYNKSVNLTTVRDTDGSLLQATAYAENDFAGQSRGRQKLGLGPSTSSGPSTVVNLGTTQGIKFCGFTFNSENNTTKVHIKSLAIYSERLTNEQLEAITS